MRALQALKSAPGCWRWASETVTGRWRLCAEARFLEAAGPLRSLLSGSRRAKVRAHDRSGEVSRAEVDVIKKIALALGLLDDQVESVLAELGLETTTSDLDGEVTARAELPAGLTVESLGAPLAELTGTIVQRPPVYSAIHVDGERPYAKARRGENVAVPERQVEVFELELLGFSPPDIELRVRCGKGTYVRTLAADLGRALGCGACLAALRRTRVGALDLSRALSLEEVRGLARADALLGSLISLSDALAHYPSVTLTEQGVAKIRQGQAVGIAHIESQELPWPSDHAFVRLLDDTASLVALAEPTPYGLRPKRVFGVV